MDAVTTLTLISKPDCHLCDVAREIVDVVVADLPENDIEIEEVSILDDPALYDAWWEKIPVVLIDDEVHAHWRVSSEALHGALLIADNTFMSPYFCNPIDFGADIVIHSGTKYLAGHNDTLAGFVVAKDKEVAEKIRFLYKTVGGCLAPWDSWLVTRGIKTLALRMEAAQKNADVLAHWLENHPKITKVFYPGLADFPGRDIHFKQSRGAGAMLSFYTDSHETALKVLKNVKLIRFAESLGGVESLITYPATQTHSDLTEEERQSRGITACLLRLSVGIEDVNDLIADLEQALG